MPLSAALSQPVPARAGIGLRAPHYQEILESRPAIGFVEAHSENYFGAGGQPLYFLERTAQLYPLSLHGVGLSLGSTDPLNLVHLVKLNRLIERFAPALVSEHLCWSSVNGQYLNDLLPLPYTEEALNHICQRVRQAQDYLRRQILVENVSSYAQFTHSTIPEWEFVTEVASTTGCALLLDVNNIYVNAMNHRFDPLGYLDAIPAAHVKEIHLAGFDEGGDCLIDTHGRPVVEPVWALYDAAVKRFGDVPTLIEWDTDIPPLAVLLAEAGKANAMLDQRHALAA